LTWALMSALNRRTHQVQHFHARCCFAGVEGARPATGLSSRHLDSWLMSPQLCREMFDRASQDSDLSIVEGRYDCSSPSNTLGGSLDTLCEWLDLPRLVVLDVTLLRGCNLPPRPMADGLLLDRVADRDEFARWQTTLEGLWGVPVLGGVEELPWLRGDITAMQPGSTISEDTCVTLAAAYERLKSSESLVALADRSPWTPLTGERPLDDVCRSLSGQSLTVAVAYDEVFHCHFPDTLDVLEIVGAAVHDFSPLHDESLPPGVDLIYLGCGRPDNFAAALSENHCLRSAIQQHVCSGGRIYAEGGGLAYLCQHLDVGSGQRVPMVGVLPAAAALRQPFVPLEPLEVSLTAGSWLGRPQTHLRGYRNPNWQITPTGPLAALTADIDGHPGIFSHYHVVGSTVHINFAAQLHLLRSLIERSQPATL
jgi:cobyrinic acid a,c-diamide synthase